MTIQLSAAVRSAQVDQFEVVAGASAKLRILTGAQPANCAAVQTGTLLGEVALPADWMANASAGVKALSGSWTAVASATGTAGYFRIVDTAGTTAHMQGSIGLGSGDLSLDNTSIAIGQTVTVTSFTVTAGNA